MARVSPSETTAAGGVDRDPGSKALRILKISQTFAYFDREGRTVHVRELGRSLVQRGHRVTVVTSSYSPLRSVASRDIDGVEVIYLRPLAMFRTLSVDPGILPLALRRVGEFDLVHIYGVYDLLGPVTAYVCRRRGVPYILEPMGMYPPIVSGVVGKRLYHAILGRRVIRGAARLIAVSEQERSDLLGVGLDPDRVIVRRNGVDIESLSPANGRDGVRMRWGLDGDAPVVLFLGRLAPVKGIEDLISAFAAAGSGSARLVLAGPEEEASYRRLLEEQAKQLGVSDRVRFVGPLYGEDKAAALRTADVFVLPSVKENFGIAAVEAMACGTPVIVTDRCGLAPLVQDRAGLVVQRGGSFLSDAIESLLSDRSLAERLGARGPAAAESLSWDGPVSQMEALYSELLAERSAAADRS